MHGSLGSIRSRKAFTVGAPLSLLIAVVFLPALSHAQFTANYQTNIISGVVSNWVGDYNVGNTTFANVLLIQTSGVLSNGFGNLGNGTVGSNNVAVVAGSGAVWRNTTGLRVGYYGSGNSLIISNTGKVFVSGSTFIGGTGSSSNNTILVTGTSSIWSNADMYVGQYTTSNSVVVSSGGQVTADSVSVSDNAPSSGNNQILVTGSESAWNTRTTFKLGTLGIGGNSLVVSNGGLVSAGTLSAGYNSPNNTLTVAGGSVVAGTLRIGAFSLAANSLLRMDGGTVTADILQAGNGANSVIEFNAGLLNTHDTAIANGAAFTVGNGVGAAEFHSLGGVHSFAGGFRVRTNALLTGCGTISAPALLDTGATVEAGCGGTLTFTGILTNNGTMRALNGTTLEFYTNVVNNGTIDVIQGQISFHGSFINNGVVLTSGLVPTVTTFRVVGPNVRITFTTVAGKSYTVETNSDLAAGGWTTWTNNIAGSGTPVTLTNFGGASLPRRFYRVKTSN